MSVTNAVLQALEPHLDEMGSIFRDRTRTWRELLDRVARVAGGLRDLGVGPDDRVAILADNSDRYLELYLAIGWAGGVITPLNTRWSADENRFAVADSEPRVIFVDAAYQAQASILAEAVPSAAIVSLADDARPGERSYEQLAGHAPIAPMVRRGADPWGLFYTGGTTGRPKGVLLGHEGMVANSQSARRAGAFTGGRLLHVAPMFHLADGAAILGMTLSGGGHVIEPGFDAGSALRTIARHRAESALLVPAMIPMLLDHPDFATTDLSSLRYVTYGASPISEAVLDRAAAALPNVGFVQAYGMTELSPVATVLSAEDHRIDRRPTGRQRSAGQPIDTVEVQIIDAEGQPVAAGEVGEIRVRGPGVMLGYWRRPAETAAALRDGWMHTGDAGRLDQDGYLYIVDRLKDMIVSGGENVYSAEVENALASHPAVQECAVIAVPDPRWGERVHAVVVPRPGASIEVAELLEHCRALIANYKCPKSISVSEAPLPRSPAGKVLKRDLRAPFWDAAERQIG